MSDVDRENVEKILYALEALCAAVEIARDLGIPKEQLIESLESAWARAERRDDHDDT